MTNERTYQIIIGVLVLIIVIGGWFAFARPSASPSEGMANNGSTATTGLSNPTGTSVNTSASSMGSQATATASGQTMTASGDSVSVADQVAGMNVAVQSVTLGQPGWVAVRDSNGRTLGAGWFSAGTQAGVSVPLLRATVAGEHYQVLLYADNGDKKFDLHTDTLITNSDGSVAGTTFTAN